MKILEAGHQYEMDDYDTGGKAYIVSAIQFMKRIGDNYPGNTGEPHVGTNCQEVIRVLIDRVKYLNKQISCYENLVILDDLRHALLYFELRAARNHNITLPYEYRNIANDLETLPACKVCGHIICHHEKELFYGHTHARLSTSR